VSDTQPQTIHFTLPGAVLTPGFWLHVWRVNTCDGRKMLYVGRTGDSSSANAAPPYRRIGQHLGTLAATNMLRTDLLKRDVSPEDCQTFEFIGHGPLFPPQFDLVTHKPVRDIVAAQEKALADALKKAGYDVLNTVSSNKPLDAALWAQVRTALAPSFPELARACQRRSG